VKISVIRGLIRVIRGSIRGLIKKNTRIASLAALHDALSGFLKFQCLNSRT